MSKAHCDEQHLSFTVRQLNRNARRKSVCPELEYYTCIMVQVRKYKSMSPQQAMTCCKPVDQLLDATLFKALADPTRIKLLSCLVKCGRSCSVTEVANCCAVDLSVVSRHLQQLARAGMIEASKSGRVVSYQVQYTALCKMLHALADSISDCAPTHIKRSCCGGLHGKC